MASRTVRSTTLLGLTLVLALSLSGCAQATVYRGLWGLSDVSRQPAREPSFEASITVVDSIPIPESIYSDESLRVWLTQSDGVIYFSLENLSNETISVIVNEASFVNDAGVASNLIPGDARSFEVGASSDFRNRIVPASSKVHLTLIPEDRVGAVGGGSYSEFASCEQASTATSRVVMPMLLGDRRVSYQFNFVTISAFENLYQVDALTDQVRATLESKPCDGDS